MPCRFRVPLIEAERLLAGDKFELVLVSGAHDGALAPTDRTVAPPEIANRSINLESHRAAMARTFLHRILRRCVILRCHDLSPLLSFVTSLSQAKRSVNDIALSGVGFS
jgi:hypothetical protein